jgi:hypothetical protein
MLRFRWTLFALLVAAGLLAACGLDPFGPPPPRTHSVRLGDVDGDGDLDAVLANGPGNTDYAGEPNSVWLNDGHGRVAHSGQRLIASQKSSWDDSHAVVLGDLDGDGDLDVVFGNAIQSPNTVWMNDGTGRFELHGEHSMKVLTEFGYGVSEGVALGDLDGDGDLDAYVGNCCRGEWIVSSGGGIDARGYSEAHNMAWLNDGKGGFADSGQLLGNESTLAVALGDLDGDGDLDAFVANKHDRGEAPVAGPANEVWLNGGQGRFTDSGQRLGQVNSYAVALGDVDRDGDLDALVGNGAPGTPGQANEIWLNDGSGGFVDSGQEVGRGNARAVALIDLDGDGDLDALVDQDTGSQIWMNDGTGRFQDSDQRLAHATGYAVDAGDVDGDGDVDVLAIRCEQGYQVWLNDGSSRMRREGREGGTTLYLASGSAIPLGLGGFAWWAIWRKRHG